MAKLRDRAAAERVRHEMLAGLSHDMQTPIGAILGFLGAVEQSGPEELAELAGRVGRQGRRLRGLVRQFLDFSRLEGDVLPDIQAVALDPAAVATAAAELADDARVELDIAAGVPDAMGDPDRVEQILVNLCSNALKFSAADEPVCLRVHATEDAVVFEVIDRGAGIADDELEEVFTKFYRGRGHGGVSGTGLGLYIGRALAEAMGASLEVASKPDEGSTFCLRLPRA
jgi:signal transduction histidine kinase